ncbi:MAG: ABC transporter permease subunit [Alphaproteobacteria bacterium]|nr:ABC transporter permease subunit [Alphaproteobacteria bacterium]
MKRLRPSRLLSVARRELVRSAAGRRGWRFFAVAMFLLLPVSALRLPSRDTPPTPVVAGEAPAALQDAVVVQERAPVTVGEADGVVTVEARGIAPALRQVLEKRLEAGSPAVRLELHPRGLTLPSRALFVALLAISLLTGPLAETLPGEREGRTMEVLLSTSLSRGEIVVGKWLAWTASASFTALVAGFGGMVTGAIAPGPWVVAMPAALGVAVALGLWLVRGAADLVGGAAAPMRVLPVVAVVGVGVAWGLGNQATLLGAAVPLGGALLVASGLVPGVLPVLAAVGGSLLASGGLLWATTRSLDRQGVKPRARDGGYVGTLVLGGLGWWLAVAGPATFVLGGAEDLPAPLDASLVAGGVLIGATAVVALLREGRMPDLCPPRRVPQALIRGLMVGVALSATELGLGSVAGPAWALPLRVRLELALMPAIVGTGAAVAVAVGSELFFRGFLHRRLGLVGTAVAWAVVVMPMDPVRGVLSGLALGLLQQRLGLLAPLAAHLAWVFFIGKLQVGGGEWVDLALVGLACVLAALRAGPKADG